MTMSSASSGGNPLDSLLRQLACLPANLPEPAEHPGTGDAAPASIAADALYGFSDFQLLRELGRGAMGVVYEARQRSLDRLVALKVLQGHLLGDPKRLARFRLEATAASRSAHENIVKIYEVGEEHGHHYIVEELVPGGRTLADQIREVNDARELPADYYRKIARLFMQASEALEVAHEQGILHRDIKPTNILLLPTGEPKVADFGVAKALDGIGATQTGESPGTPSYRSPEQIDAQLGTPGPVSDVFSLGTTLYESLTLTRLFTGDSDLEIARKITLQDAQDPREIRERVPADLANICLKALEKQPARRYPSMAELAADLRRFLANEPIHALAPTPADRARKWILRNPVKSTALGLTTMGLFVVAALLLVNLRSNRELRIERANILHFSARRDLNDLIARADTLWPAFPENIPAYEKWISDARTLTSDLPLHRGKRDELLARALPQSESERLAAREREPDAAKLAGLERELNSKRAALRQRRDGVRVELPDVDWSRLPNSTLVLLYPVPGFVDPDRTEYGDEGLGFLLSQRAAEVAANDHEYSSACKSLAWASFALGRDEDALVAAKSAVARAPENRKAVFEQERVKLEVAVASLAGDAGWKLAEQEISRLKLERDRLGRALDGRIRSVFSLQQSETRWRHDQLTELIGGLEGLERGLLAAEGVSASHGWSIPHRLAFARSLEQGFSPGGEYDRAWQVALPQIRLVYPGLNLVPQIGLVPLGPDPDSGLWEFAHLQSGDIAVRGKDRRLILEEGTGIVFVLLAGGRCLVGAQRTDPSGPNYDPKPEEDEFPVHEVELPPYFISKYEMTQGQWLRITGENPSLFQPPSPLGLSLLHPVERVSWTRCAQVMNHLQLVLPDEGQWEHAARAGTRTPWWTGLHRESLHGAANLLDQAAVRSGMDYGGTGVWAELDDGFAVHAPVDQFRPNAFGLHNVHGNVAEWTGNPGGIYGVRQYQVSPAVAGYMVRGGAFGGPPEMARSSERTGGPPSTADHRIGLRPARVVTLRR